MVMSHCARMPFLAGMPLPPASTPSEAYTLSMSLIAQRFRVVENYATDEVSYLNAELHALQVRKIVEGVSYAALSAFEHVHGDSGQRTSDAKKLLDWMVRKKLLVLPGAVTVERVSEASHSIRVTLSPARDLGPEFLDEAYVRSSDILHERHPERLDGSKLEGILRGLQADASRLRGWLWNHWMPLPDQAFLVQMGMNGTSSFWARLDKRPENP